MINNICNKCGRTIDVVGVFCPYCGNKLEEKPKLKKSSKIFLISYAVVLLLLLVIGMGAFSISYPIAISKIEAATPEEFTRYVHNMGCETREMEDSLEGVSFHQYTDESCPVQIEYLTFLNADTRVDFYRDKKSSIKEESSYQQYSEINFPSYQSYTIRGKKYQSIIMVDDMILSVESFSHQDLAEQVADDLGLVPHGNTSWWRLSYVAILMILLLEILCFFKIMVKFGKSGWIIFVPIYNVLVLGEKLYGKKWYGLLYLVPIVNIVFFLVSCYQLGKVFNRDDIGCILLVVLPQIFIPILAFDTSKYVGKKEKVME